MASELERRRCDYANSTNGPGGRDAIAVRKMLEDFLSLYGYDVLVASHPDTAFKRLKQSVALLDAMILDIGLDDNRSGSRCSN